MSVYVDDAAIAYRGMLMHHMFGDTTAELLAMVDRIGVQRKWIQNAGTYREHFDVCAAKRAAAVRAGAIEIDARGVVALLGSRRAALNAEMR